MHNTLGLQMLSGLVMAARPLGGRGLPCSSSFGGFLLRLLPIIPFVLHLFSLLFD